MELKELKNKSQNLLLLNKNILRNFEKRQNVLDANIKYWLKKGELIQLKKGFYVLKDRYQTEIDKDLYLEYLANQLVVPSYLSLEYVLAKYQILSEPAQSITSITTLTTRETVNQFANFRYYSVTRRLFTGFKASKRFYGSPVLEATKEKAVFDYLYLRFLKDEPINQESIKNLRLNWENISSKEFVKIYSYLDFTNSQRVKKILDLIKILFKF